MYFLVQVSVTRLRCRRRMPGDPSATTIVHPFGVEGSWTHLERRRIGRSRHSDATNLFVARRNDEQACKWVHNVVVADRYFQSSVLPYSGPQEIVDRAERSRIDSRWFDLNARYRFTTIDPSPVTSQIVFYPSLTATTRLQIDEQRC